MKDQLPDSEVIINNYPERSGDDVEWLWHSDWYDGPLAGMVEWNKQKYWAVYFEDDDKKHRLYTLLKLTDEQQKSEEYWHELFELCVSCEHSSDKCSDQHRIYTKESQQFFYTRRKMDYEELDWSEATLVGWFRY